MALNEDPTNTYAQKRKDATYNTIQEIENKLKSDLEWAEEQNVITIQFFVGESVTFSKNDYINWLKTEAYAKLGEYEEAISHLNKIENFPGDQYFIQILAPTLIKINADKKAIELIDDALTTYITHEGQAEKLGYQKVKALWKLGKYEDALEYASRYPVDGQFIYHDGFREDATANDRLITGILYNKVGDLEKAEQYYNSALNTIYREPLTGNTGYWVSEDEITKGIIKFLFDVGDYQDAIPYIELLDEGDEKKEFLKEIEYYKIIQDVETFENDVQNVAAEGGGCLIATATYGSELAPQVQMLREIRDSALLQTSTGSTFMAGFNQFYYSFSPVIADYERENPVFKEMVKLAITPLITSLSILNYVEIDSDAEALSYGIGIILMNIWIYFAALAFIIFRLKSKFS